MNESVQAIRQQEADHEAQQRRVEYIRSEFMRSAKLGDMSAPAPWAPDVLDMTKSWRSNCRRTSTVGEAIFSAVDLGDGPTTSDVLGLLCKSAFGKSDEFSAYQLLNRLADSFVKHCV